MKIMWIFYAILSATFAALVAIFGKVGLRNIDPILATIIRGIIMALFLIIMGFILQKFDGFSFNSLSSKGWVFIILAGLSGVISWIFYFIALKKGPPTGVVAIDKTSIALVAILSIAFLSEAFSWKTIFGVIMIIVGAIILAI